MGHSGWLRTLTSNLLVRTATNITKYVDAGTLFVSSDLRVTWQGHQYFFIYLFISGIDFASVAQSVVESCILPYRTLTLPFVIKRLDTS